MIKKFQLKHLVGVSNFLTLGYSSAIELQKCFNKASMFCGRLQLATFVHIVGHIWCVGHWLDTPDCRAIWLENLKILSRALKKLVANRGLGLTHCIQVQILKKRKSTWSYLYKWITIFYNKTIEAIWDCHKSTVWKFLSTLKLHCFSHYL